MKYLLIFSLAVLFGCSSGSDGDAPSGKSLQCDSDAVLSALMSFQNGKKLNSEENLAFDCAIEHSEIDSSLKKLPFNQQLSLLEVKDEKAFAAIGLGFKSLYTGLSSPLTVYDKSLIDQELVDFVNRRNGIPQGSFIYSYNGKEASTNLQGMINMIEASPRRFRENINSIRPFTKNFFRYLKLIQSYESEKLGNSFSIQNRISSMARIAENEIANSSNDSVVDKNQKVLKSELDRLLIELSEKTYKFDRDNKIIDLKGQIYDFKVRSEQLMWKYHNKAELCPLDQCDDIYFELFEWSEECQESI